MTHAATKLLEEFDALSDADRTEILAELLSRAAIAPHCLPSDGELLNAANELFTELDRRQQP